MKEGILYSDIRPLLRTGDIIFFHGADFISNTIGKLEKNICGDGDFTHVGMVILNTSFPVGHPYRCSNIGGSDTSIFPYIFESTQSGELGDGVLNVEFRSFLGVQLRRLDDVIDAYDASPNTRIAWGSLKDEYSISSEMVIDIFRQYNGIRYDLSIIDLLSTIYPKMRKIRKLRKKLCCKSVDQWLFCSELLAKIYTDVGFIDNVDIDNIVPVNFLPNSTNNKTNYLINR